MNTYRPRFVRRREMLWVGLLSVLLLLAYGVAGDQRESLGAFQRGDALPTIDAVDRNGHAVSNSTLRGSVVVLLFGETSHDRTTDAWEQVCSALDGAREPIELVVVLSRRSQPGLFDTTRCLAPIAPRIVHDATRDVFAACGVRALPSALVVDREGHIVHALAGSSSRFGDVLIEAVHLASGRIDAQAFERELHPQLDEMPPAKKRALRFLHLGQRLLEQQMPDLAEARFRDAILSDPQSVPAHVALGELLRCSGRADEAESAFRAALAVDSTSAEASVGLAFVCVRRGGTRLELPEKLIREVLQNDPTNARAHYLMGLVHEANSRTAEAATSYRRAAELAIVMCPGDDA